MSDVQEAPRERFVQLYLQCLANSVQRGSTFSVTASGTKAYICRETHSCWGDCVSMEQQGDEASQVVVSGQFLLFVALPAAVFVTIAARFFQRASAKGRRLPMLLLLVYSMGFTHHSLWSRLIFFAQNPLGD